MTQDWLDNILDEYPPESAPGGFRERVLARARSDRFASSSLLLLWLPRATAAAALLMFGFWLGSGRPELAFPAPTTSSAALASAELVKIYESQHLLDEAWEFVLDEDLELAFTDAAAGTWDPAEGEE